MRALLNRIASLAGLGGILLLATGAVYLWGGTRRPSIGLRISVEPNDQVLVKTTVGETRRVVFRATNHSDVRSVQLLGGQGSCNPTGCVNVNGVPLTIPPGRSGSFEVEYMGVQPGRFTREIPIYTDCPGQGEIRLVLTAAVTGAVAGRAEDE